MTRLSNTEIKKDVQPIYNGIENIRSKSKGIKHFKTVYRISPMVESQQETIACIMLYTSCDTFFMTSGLFNSYFYIRDFFRTFFETF